MEPGAVVDHRAAGLAGPAGGLHTAGIGVVEVEDAGCGDGLAVDLVGAEVGAGFGAGGEAALAGGLLDEDHADAREGAGDDDGGGGIDACGFELGADKVAVGVVADLAGIARLGAQPRQGHQRGGGGAAALAQVLRGAHGGVEGWALVDDEEHVDGAEA